MGNFELIRALIAKNVPLTSLSEETGLNCLMVALQSGRKELIYKISNYFLNAKAFNQQDGKQGETLLMKAISRKDIDIVEHLLDGSLD